METEKELHEAAVHTLRELEDILTLLYERAPEHKRRAYRQLKAKPESLLRELASAKRLTAMHLDD